MSTFKKIISESIQAVLDHYSSLESLSEQQEIEYEDFTQCLQILKKDSE